MNQVLAVNPPLNRSDIFSTDLQATGAYNYKAQAEG